MRALIVEKDHTVRDLVKVAIQQLDAIAVDTAEDAWALELAKENPYNLLVVDDDLGPGADGMKVLQELRQMGIRAPAILLTHGPPEARAREADALNLSAVLTVPLDTVQVFKALAAARQRMDTR